MPCPALLRSSPWQPSTAVADRAADAVSEAEWADEAADTDDAWLYGSVAAWLRRTGSTRRPRGQLAEPNQHQVNGHWEKAAQLWTDLGCPNEAALARLDAAEEGALREALSAFTELGASAVARLTRQKLRAIAARLFISAKTVDHHVSAVLAKLGAPNRNAAAAQAAKLGLIRNGTRRLFTSLKHVGRSVCSCDAAVQGQESDFRHFGTTRIKP